MKKNVWGEFLIQHQHLIIPKNFCIVMLHKIDNKTSTKLSMILAIITVTDS